MGANLDYRVYATFDKDEVKREWVEAMEADLYDNGHSYSGGIGVLGPDIQWEERMRTTEKEALDYIQGFHKKWEPPMAVSFTGGWVVGGWCSS